MQPLLHVDQPLTLLDAKVENAGETSARVSFTAGGDVTVTPGASFIGDLSVDIADMRSIDPGVYHDVVSLWAPGDATAREKAELVRESFRGAGTRPFTQDRATLTVVDPMRVDMCNIAFHGIHQQMPLPPATDTIGSDYFLMHLVHKARLPGVLHNRHIVNFHTAERKTEAGFAAYQTRLVKFFLSMHFLHDVYARMAADGDRLLDEKSAVRVHRITGFIRSSLRLSDDANVRKLDVLDAAYRRLGGRYARFADSLRPRRAALLAGARQDMADFAFLAEAWPELVRAARTATAGVSR